MYLFYLDEYHLDDLLYVPSLAQRMGRMQRARPACLFVHGGGEKTERLFEAEGLFPDKVDGLVQPRTPEEALLVERALQQVNRRIVGALTEEGVPAVGFRGADRGILKLDAGGALATGRLGWLADVVEQGAVPVVSALAQPPAGAVARAVPVASAAKALAQGLRGEERVVVFFTRNNQPGVVEGEKVLHTVAWEAVPPALIPDPEALRVMAAAGLPVLLTSPSGLFSAEKPGGTMIITIKTPKKG